jgi:hypothetical protein
MKVGLVHQGEYPEPVRAELEQLVAGITTSHAVEHDAEGRQRVSCGKWRAGASQTLATATITAIACTVPDSRNAPGKLTMDTVGQVRIGEPGVYLVVGQIAYDTSVTGRRIAYLRLNGTVAGVMDVAVAGFCHVQVVEAINCVAGDVIALYGYQDSGGNLAVIGSPTLNETFLRVTRM